MKFQQTGKTQHPGLWQGSPVEHSLPSTLERQHDGLAEVIEYCAGSSTNQWVTVVGGSRAFIAQLMAAGIPATQIRWLRSSNTQQREWALEQASLAGTSGVIIGWLNQLSPRFCQRVKMASRLSQTKSFLFEEDTLIPHLH